MVNRFFFSLLNTDHVSLNQSWNYKNVNSPFYRLYLIDGGSGTLSNPQQSINMQPGFLYLIPSFTTVNQTCASQLSQYYVHFIEETPDGSSLFAQNRNILEVEATDVDTESFKRLVALNPGRDLRKSDNPKVYEKSNVLNSFRDINDQLSTATQLETQGLIMVLLSRFISNHKQQPQAQEAIPSAIMNAINYIQSNLAENITVEDLAARANLSTDYFSRSFCKHTGLRPLQYIHQKRIERAQFLIVTTNYTFAEIAAETGFESLSYFSRIFKNTTGQTPGTYKMSHANYL